MKLCATLAAGVDVLVTSWVYFGKPEDIKMKFSQGGCSATDLNSD